MTRAGIDTSVLIGLLDPKDIWHDSATTLKNALQAHQVEVAIFDCVLAGDLRVDVLWILPDVPALYDDVVELVRSSKGELNFHDALIALSCRSREIPFIASFDGDFDNVAWLQRLAEPDDLP